jgi:hypothetical protein
MIKATLILILCYSVGLLYSCYCCYVNSVRMILLIQKLHLCMCWCMCAVPLLLHPSNHLQVTNISYVKMCNLLLGDADEHANYGGNLQKVLCSG